MRGAGRVKKFSENWSVTRQVEGEWLSNASDRANPVISQDPMDHDPGHLKV